MLSRSAFLPFLLVLLPGCLERQEPAREALVPPGDPLPPASADAQPVREPSVLQGYDPAAPDQSLQGIAGGLSGSRLQFETDRLDLGKVYQFEERQFEFPFTAVGEEPVIVTNLDHNCGCTHSEIRADWLAQPGEEAPLYVLGREIPPGAKGRVVGTYSAERRSGIKITTITLRGNMADTPVKLEISVDNLRIFDVTPATVRFGDVLTGGGDAPPAIQDFRIVAREPFEITEWRRLPAGLKIEPLDDGAPTGDGGEWARKYRASLGAGAPEGLLSTSAVAATSIGVDLEILVSANVIPPIAYTPSNRLAFGFPELGEERTRTIEIQARMAGVKVPTPSVEILGDAAARMRAEVEVVEPERLLRVKVTLPADTPVGVYAGVLRLTYPEGSEVAARDFAISARVKEKRG